MGVTTTNNKPLNPRGNDQSPLAYNRAKLFSGKALDFDGVNDYVSVSYSDTLGGVWSWVSIIEADVLSGYQELFGGMYGGSNATIYLNGSQLTIYTNQDNLNTAFDFETGKKYHVACSQSGDTISVYVNGQAAGSVSLTIPLNSTSGTYIIGKRPNQANEYFNGKISGVKVFNTALTAAQVADLYNNPELVVPTGVDNTALKLWLPMQEGAGTTALNGAPDALGSEEVTNGDFATDSDWNKAAGWTISGGKANANTTGDYINLYQSGVFTIGKTYKVSFDITDYTSGDIRITEAGYDISGLKNAVGSYSFVFTASYSSLYIQGVNSFVGSIDNVSVKEIQNVGTISGATWTHGVGAPVAQTSVIDWNKVTLDLTNEVLVPQGLTSGRDLLGNLFENVRKQGALNLDGNSWAEVHDNASLDITSAITLEAWVYWDSTETAKGIVGKWNSSSTQCYLIYVASSSRAQFYTSTTGSNAQSVEHTIPSDGWVHIVGTDDGTNQKLYINGAEEATRASLGSIFANDKVLEIGRYNEATIRQYPQPIAQPRIYNRALTAEEVQRNYNAGKNTYTN